MARIYEGGSAESRYRKTDLGRSYNPQQAGSEEDLYRQYKDRIVEDGKIAQRNLERQIEAQTLYSKVARGVESAALQVEQNAASAELQMQQKYASDTLKIQHTAEEIDIAIQGQNLSASNAIETAALQAQQQTSSANLQAFSTAIDGLISFAGTTLDYVAEQDKISKAKADEAAKIDAAFGSIEDLTSNTVDTFNSQEKARAVEDSAVESAIQKSTNDPYVQDALRQQSVVPQAAIENVRRGNAYSSAEDFAAFWLSWTNDQNVQYTRADGSTFTAATANSRADLVQISNAAKKAFYKAAGINELPSAQVANVIAPVVIETARSWLTTRSNELVAANQAGSLEKATLNAIKGLRNGDDVGNIFHTLSSQRFGTGTYKGNRGEANKDAVKEILNWAVRNDRPDVINELEKEYKIYKDGVPQKGTQLGKQYEELFAKARQDVVQEVINDEVRRVNFAKTQIDILQRDLNGALAEVNDPAKEVELNLKTADAIEALGTPEALLKARQMRAERNYSPFTHLDIADRQASGEIFTNDELAMLVESGDITAAEAKARGWNENSAKSVDTIRAERVEGFQAEFKAQGSFAVLEAINKGITGQDSLDSTDKRLLMEGQGKSRINDIADRLANEINLELMANPDMTDVEIREYIDKRGKDIAKEVSFTLDGGIDYDFGGPQRVGGNRITTTRSPTSGDIVIDIRNVPPSDIDAILISDVKDAAILTTRELAIANAAFGSGRDLPSWLEDKAAALGINAETLLRGQNSFYNNEMPSPPVVNSSRFSTSSSGSASGTRSTSSPDLSQYDTGETYGDVSLDNLRNSVISKESSGSFTVVNEDTGALGYGQVLPENVESWSQDALGYKITQRQFLANPELQMHIINDRFRKMMKSQAAAGYTGELLIRRVASIWYSGQASWFNSTRPQDYGSNKYPSISAYTLDVVKRYNN